MPGVHHHDPIARALEAIAHPMRLAIVSAVVKAGAGGLASGEIARRLGISAATTSHHLSHLTAAELVKAERRGRWVIYRSASGELASLLRIFGIALGTPLPLVSSALGRRAESAEVAEWHRLRLDRPRCGSVETRIDYPASVDRAAAAPYYRLERLH